jgi:hypothetical protein
MKIYYYFLYRIYWFFRDYIKEGHKMSLISTSILSTIFLYFALYSIFLALWFFKLSIFVDFGNYYKFWILLIGMFIWVFNYYFLIKPRNFLRMNFNKDLLGAFLILLSIISLGAVFLTGANKNREKIIKQKQNLGIENKK